jgi:hypothetical protein
MTYAFQFQDQIHGHWQTVATFPSVKAAEAATDEFGLLLTERYDETRIIDSALA